MKKKLTPKKRLRQRITAAAVLVSWLPTAFSSMAVYAEQINTEAVTDNDIPLSIDPDAAGDPGAAAVTDADSGEIGFDVPDPNAASEEEEENLTGIRISQDGKQLKIEAESGQPWDEEGVTGEEVPTQDAPYVGNYLAAWGKVCRMLCRKMRICIQCRSQQASRAAIRSSILRSAIPIRPVPSR